jgi:hypothetical protein
MAISPFAGKQASKDMLVDPIRLEHEYYACRPDVGDRNQLVSCGWYEESKQAAYPKGVADGARQSQQSSGRR